MKTAVAAIIVFALGLAAGWWLGSGDESDPAPPEGWLARIDGTYITDDEFVDEMRRRGGTQPGQFHDLEQKKRLLEAVMYRKAVTQAAVDDGLDREPPVRRSLDRILVNRYLEDHLRPLQEEAEVSDEEVERIYSERHEEYAVPARRRVAMIRIALPDGAEEQARTEARQRIDRAREEALELNGSHDHFGRLAMEYSDDQSSRYRGGVIGWIGEEAPERYRHDPVVVETANAMREPGEVSEVLEGEDGYYLVRLVDYQPQRTRPLEELASGIRRGLQRERRREVEAEFRERMLERYEIEVRESRLGEIEPLGPPAGDEPRRPPEVPSS